MTEEKGISKDVRTIFRMISDDDKVNMDYFYLESLNRNYKRIGSTSEISNFIQNSALTQEDINFLLNYSGYNYKHINAVLRGTWNYEDNGNISNMPIYREDAARLSELIMNNPSELQDDVIAYRGVDISYFRQYGIESLEDLLSLEGRHLHDRGFVSTSLQEDRCFFGKDNELGLNYNIKIEYMIPHEFRDGIYLNSNMSYSPGQEEYVINKGNIARVGSVVINPDNTAVIRTTLIPKEIYDEYYRARSNDASKKQ